jgi:hypothetical protein
MSRTPVKLLASLVSRNRPGPRWDEQICVRMSGPMLEWCRERAEQSQRDSPGTTCTTADVIRAAVAAAMAREKGEGR